MAATHARAAAAFSLSAMPPRLSDGAAEDLQLLRLELVGRERASIAQLGQALEPVEVVLGASLPGYHNLARVSLVLDEQGHHERDQPEKQTEDEEAQKAMPLPFGKPGREVGR